jgi:hypothetical protein
MLSQIGARFFWIPSEFHASTIRAKIVGPLRTLRRDPGEHEVVYGAAENLGEV